MCMQRYLGWTALIVGAIILVDEDGILNVFHGKILEQYVSHKPITGPRPCLDPNSIIRPGKYWTDKGHILYTSFIQVFTQAPNAVRQS